MLSVLIFHMLISGYSLQVGYKARSCDALYREIEYPGYWEQCMVNGIPTYQDLTYKAKKGGDLTLDIYLPCSDDRGGSNDNVPAMLYFHGGGWVAGDKGVITKQAMQLLSKGIAVVSVRYRLVNEGQWEKSTWPAQGHDIVAATLWLKENALAYKINPDRVGCWGDSAGGQLCAWLASARALDAKTRMTVAVDMFGINCFFCDGTNGNDLMLAQHGLGSNDAHDDFYFNFPEGRMAEIQELRTRARASNVEIKDLTSDETLLSDAELVRSADPLHQVRYVSKDMTTPMFIGHGARDNFVPPLKSFILAQELSSVNVTHDYTEVPTGDHSFVGWPEEPINSAISFVSRFLFQ